MLLHVNETNANVVQIYKILTSNAPMHFFKFIINPESYAQTVENLFYLSFLIRDDKVRIFVDERDSEPYLDVVPVEDEDEVNEIHQFLDANQLVLSIDMDIWRVYRFIQ